MGLFNRRKQVTSEQQCEALRELVGWEYARGTTEWREAAQRLLKLGGWEWWLILARAAESDKNYNLIGKLNCFTIQSKGVLLGDPGFIPPTRGICQSLDTITVRCLRNAPPEHMIHDSPSSQISVEQVMTWATGRIETGNYPGCFGE